MSTPINKTHTQAVATVVGSGDSDVTLRSLRRDDENFFSSNANVAISRIIYDVSTGIDIVRGGEIILQLSSGAYDIDFAAMGSALSARGNYDIHISGPSSNLDYVTILLSKESGYGPIDIGPNLNPNIFDLVINDDSVYTVTEFGRETDDNLESFDDYVVSLVRQNANFYLYNITDRVKNIDDLVEYQIGDQHQIIESVFVQDNPEISVIRNIDETLKKYDGTYFLEEYVNNSELYTSDDLFAEYIAQVYALGIELDDAVSFDDSRILSQGFNEYLDAPVIVSDDASYRHGMGLNPRFDDLVRGRDDAPELVHKPYTGIHLAVNVQDEMEYHPEFIRTPVDPVNTKEEMDFLFAGVRTLFLQDILNPYDFMRVPQVLSGNIDTDAVIVDQISNIPVVSVADATDGADIVDSIHPVPVITIIENIPVLDEYQDEWNAVLDTEDELTPDDYIRFPIHRDLIIDDQIDKGEWFDLPAMELTSGIVDAPVGVDDLGTVFGIVPNITDAAVFEEDHNRIIGQNTEEAQGTDDFIRFPVVVDLPLEDQIDDVDLVDSLNNNPVPNLSSDYTTSEETTNIQGRGINDSVATEEDIYRQIDFARDIYEVPKNSEGAYFDQDYTSLEERYVNEDLWDDRIYKEFPIRVADEQFDVSDSISKETGPRPVDDLYHGEDHDEIVDSFDVNRTINLYDGVMFQDDVVRSLQYKVDLTADVASNDDVKFPIWYQSELDSDLVASESMYKEFDEESLNDSLTGSDILAREIDIDQDENIQGADELYRVVSYDREQAEEVSASDPSNIGFVLSATFGDVVSGISDDVSKGAGPVVSTVASGDDTDRDYVIGHSVSDNYLADDVLGREAVYFREYSDTSIPDDLNNVSLTIRLVFNDIFDSIDAISKDPVSRIADATNQGDITDSVDRTYLNEVDDAVSAPDEFLEQWNAVIYPEDIPALDDDIKFPIWYKTEFQSNVDPIDSISKEFNNLGIVDSGSFVHDNPLFGFDKAPSDIVLTPEVLGRLSSYDRDILDETYILDTANAGLIVSREFNDSIDVILDVADPIPVKSPIDIVGTLDEIRFPSRSFTIEEAVITEEDLVKGSSFTREPLDILKNTDGAYFEGDYTDVADKYTIEDVFDETLEPELIP